RADLSSATGLSSVPRLLEELAEIFLPYRSLKESIVAARFFGNRHQDEMTLLYFGHFVFGDAHLTRVPEIVHGIDQHDMGADLAKARHRIVVARGVILVEEMVG